MQHFVFLFTFLVFFSCFTSKTQQDTEQETSVLPGIYQTDQYIPEITGKKVALVMHSSSQLNGVLLVDSLLSLGIKISKIFTPEHGFWGDKAAGEKIGNQNYRNIPVISLYGSNKKLKTEDLEDVDVLIFDLQDLGLRFYTYISTLHYVLEAAAATQTPVLVLDRLHPFYNILGGPILEPKFKSFIGMHPVPVIYGMTIGEYAMMIKGEAWIDHSSDLELKVVKNLNFSQDSYVELERAPSPNLPNHNSIKNYPHLCFFEGTTFSLGRGTDFPFEVLGHPKLEEFDTILVPTVRASSKWPKYQDKSCSFVRIEHSKYLDSTTLDLRLLMKYNDWAAQNKLVFIDRPDHFDKLAGTDKLRNCMDNKSLCDDFWDEVHQGLVQFSLLRDKYRLYP